MDGLSWRCLRVGASIGSMRYSPFGERVESTGLLPFMGFTGEPQDPASHLTYLRSRIQHQVSVE